MTLMFPSGIALTFILASSAAFGEEGNARRGGEVFRACVACHSLEPGVNLSGPSLANLWEANAGAVDGYVRYSKGLKSADFAWDATTLNAWLNNPRAILPGTYMAFQGIANDAKRADLIAFLKIAMAAGGGETVVEKGLVSAAYVRGQQPQALSPALASARVTGIRHCGDGYFIKTANGAETPHWEKNIRLKIDSRETGPTPGTPVILKGGMRGDRFFVVFSSVDELKAFIVEECEPRQSKG